MSDLIDTTEMYLKAIFELEEEGIVPLRARIAERLGQSGPTVSQTVARMERDRLLHVDSDRHLELTPDGRSLATRVMRKHRLAECLLIQVIGLDWELVHEEACRWEHVMSEEVERRLLDILGHPTVSPYGLPIPGLSELGEPGALDDPGSALTTLDQVSLDSATRVIIRRLAEPLQTDTVLMSRLRRAGVQPGASVTVISSPEGLLVGSGGETTEISDLVASHVFVTAR
ncbi:MAG: DtxR family transcriptional regulator, Mn-dependent transcriptional regulator [Actinomycetota bacterium]|nr:DtxR family transcriptional regulator, Mn-dependent transcriptional regulator [Actinomycetota bacterium]